MAPISNEDLKSGLKTIKSVLMDLDGTLCDCTELHYISLNKSLKNICGFEISREDHNSIFNALTTNQKLDMLENFYL